MERLKSYNSFAESVNKMKGEYIGPRFYNKQCDFLWSSGLWKQCGVCGKKNISLEEQTSPGLHKMAGTPENMWYELSAQCCGR